MRIRVLVENTGSEPGLKTEHGLSLFIETGVRTILFDMGHTDAFAFNARAMGIGLSSVDMAVISHGHDDHGGGLPVFLSANDHAKVYVSDHAFERHLNACREDIGLDRAMKNNPRIVPVGEYLHVAEGVDLYACNTRVPAYAAGTDGLLMEENGVSKPDDFRHEQYLLLRQSGKRVVFSGCSHKGVLNIMRWLKPDVFIGGFHFMHLDLSGEGKRIVEETSRILLSYPTTYYTCHCTGMESYRCLKDLMHDRLAYLATGTELTL